MKIREANKKDLGGVLELVKLITDYHYQLHRYYKPFSKYRGLKSYIKGQLGDKTVKIIVAEDDNEEIVGFMVGVIVSCSYSVVKKIGNIDSAFVKKNFRRKGLSEKMLKELQKWFKGKNIKYIEANADIRNKLGVKAWRKLGFGDYRVVLRKTI
jgi:ribosomal protein S18 acetylase RimI-like enzyme